MTQKPWYLSKVVWFNGVTIIVAVATFLGWTPDQNLMAQLTAFLTAIAPVVNLGLRFVTNSSITGTN